MATTRSGPFPVSKGDILTGVIVQGGDMLRTIATGSVSFARVVGQSHDADGDDPYWKTPSDFPAPNLAKHSLILKFGGGPWYQGGKDKTVTVPIGESGEVVLRTNDHDDWLWDNDGFWEVTLDLTRPDPLPPGPPQPILRITAIEVVQAIQRAGNSVRLVQGKRTIVRVFVDSGLRNGQDVGPGPNLWPGVTGSLLVLDLKGGRPITPVNTPLNRSITAQPASSIDREQWGHSLNFELPANTLARDPVDPPGVKSTTMLEIRAFVRTSPAVSGPGGVASASVTVTLHERFAQPLVPILVTLTYPTVANPAPPMSSFNAAVLTGALPRYPVAENGFTIRPSIPWTTSIDISADLQLAGLLSQLGTVALISSTPVDGIRCALIPDGPYRTGIAGKFIWGSRLPVLINQASAVDSFAHELGHTFGVDHSMCTGQEGWYDGRIPGRIDDVGLNVATRTVIRKLTPDIMSYCTNPWCSVQVYDIIFDQGVI